MLTSKGRRIRVDWCTVRCSTLVDFYFPFNCWTKLKIVARQSSFITSRDNDRKKFYNTDFWSTNGFKNNCWIVTLKRSGFNRRSFFILVRQSSWKMVFNIEDNKERGGVWGWKIFCARKVLPKLWGFNCQAKESLLKGKVRYGWPPGTNLST